MTDDSDAPAEAGPERIRSIAVHREDVANALEATLRSDREVVLRVTPPYSGRMRARLHSLGTAAGSSAETDDAGGSTAIHIDPRDLVTGAPAYPEADETAADHPDAGVENRRARHAEAVASWRERVRASVVTSVPIADGDGSTRDVDVTVLG
mgnify:CR=1 FL=1